MKLIRKRTLFFKWLYTYLVLIGVSLIFIVCIMFVYNKSIREDMSRLNIIYLEQVEALVDGQFESIDRLVYSVGMTADMLHIMNMEQTKSAADRYDILTIAKELDLYAQASSVIHRIDVYAQLPELVISEKSTYTGHHMDLFGHNSFGISKSVLTGLLSDTHHQSVIRLNDLYPKNGGDNPLLYIQSLPIQFEDNPRGAMMVVIDEKNLQALTKKELFGEGKLLVFDEKQQLLFSSDTRDYSDHYPISSLLSMTDKTVTIEGETYIKDMVKGSRRNWTYISMIPKSSYYERTDRLRTTIVIMTIVFMLIDLLIAYGLTSLIYRPVKRMVQSYSQHQDNTTQSEFEYIDSVIRKNIITQEQLRKELTLQEEPLKSAFLSQLMRGFLKDQAYIEQQLQRYELYLSEEGYMVMTIHMEIDSRDDKELRLSQFIIRNVFDEILSAYYDCYFIDIEGRVAAIVNMNEDSVKIEEIKDEITLTIDMLNMQFRLPCRIGVSQHHIESVELMIAYQESLEAIAQARVNKQQKMYFSGEITELTVHYEFSGEDEYKLMHFIRSGSLEQTVERIDQIINDNMENNELRFGYIQCLMYDLLGTIIKTVDNQAFSQRLNGWDPVRKMKQASNVEEMREIVVKSATVACDINRGKNDAQMTKSIEEQVNDYIQKNYQDPELNVSKLGEVFHMTPSYLSRLYKKESGNSILHYLNYVRIEASKEYLKDSSLTINDIAIKVGYQYTSAFIRFFKSHTGVTPGKFKEFEDKQL